MARRDAAAITVSVYGRDKLIERLKQFETNVQQRVARTAAMRVIKKHAKPRLRHLLNAMDGMDVTADALQEKLLPKRKYRNGATLFAKYQKVIRLYKQRYGEEPNAEHANLGYPYYYPWVLEYGRPNMAPRAPFRTAARSQRGAMKREMRKELSREIKRAKRKNYMEG